MAFGGVATTKRWTKTKNKEKSSEKKQAQTNKRGKEKSRKIFMKWVGLNNTLRILKWA